MSGRPVHLLAAAAVAAAASLFAISSASAGCYGCGASYSHQAPVAYYTAPVVYSYSYAAPVAYASGCGCGGYASSYGYGYAARPMYAVNQGPAYTEPVVNAEPTPAYDEGYRYRRAPRYYGDGGYRIRRHWGYRHGYGHRFGMKRYRYGAVGYGRYSMRHPIAGPGSVFRGPRHTIRHGGMHRAHHPMGNRMHMMHRTPGVVHPKP